jgi:general secretion pathway protein D
MIFFKSISLSFGLSLLLLSNLNANCSNKLFSISSNKNTRIIDFVEYLSGECNLSIIITDPQVNSFLKSKLNRTNINNLTIIEIFDIILKDYNLSYTLNNKLLKISYLTTRMFEINYILSTRKGIGSTNIAFSSHNGQTQNRQNPNIYYDSLNIDDKQNQVEDSTTESSIQIKSTDEVVFWKELDLELQKILNRPQDIYEAEAPIINKNAGIVTATATIKQMNRLERYLKKLQAKVQLQVLIDVQLLSVKLNKNRTTGVDWSQLFALQNMQVSAFGSLGDTTKKNHFTISGGGSLKEVIKFLNTQGNVSSVSNPKVLTLNNQPALITAGTEYFYKITNSTNQQGAGGGLAATSHTEIIKSVFAGVLLSITPEISDDKTITLKINPSLSEVIDGTGAYDQGTSTTTPSGGRTSPPDIVRSQLSSVVTVQDGSRIILGGLINSKKVVKINKIPILGDIPILNYLFKYESKSKVVQELVIIIEPHIISKDEKKVSLSDLKFKNINNKSTEKIFESLEVN